MATTTVQTRPLAERADKLKDSLTELLGFEVTLEEARDLLVADFIENLRNEG